MPEIRVIAHINRTNIVEVTVEEFEFRICTHVYGNIVVRAGEVDQLCVMAHVERGNVSPPAVNLP